VRGGPGAQPENKVGAFYLSYNPSGERKIHWVSILSQINIKLQESAENHKSSFIIM